MERIKSVKMQLSPLRATIMPTGPLFIYPYIIRRGCSGAAGGSPWTRLILPEKKI